MRNLGFAEAFAKYGAKLKNVNWSVCAVGRDGSLVVSLWQHHIKKEGDFLVCRDSTARWSGPGRNEFKILLEEAKATSRPISLVIASTPRPDLVDAGGDASKVPKTFAVREDLVGEVAEIDGEAFAIRFRMR